MGPGEVPGFMNIKALLLSGPLFNKKNDKLLIFSATPRSSQNNLPCQGPVQTSLASWKISPHMALC